MCGYDKMLVNVAANIIQFLVTPV